MRDYVRLCEIVDAAILEHRRKGESRKYLGASQIGNSCTRAIQLEYLGIGEGEYSPQTLRIFDAGHIFEQLVLYYLELAGLVFATPTEKEKQFAFSSAGGKLRGHVDGVIVGAPPELEWTFPMIFECKSMNSRNWTNLKKNGLAKAKPVYAAQVAIYQAYMELEFSGVSSNPALFCAINKDNSELYFELVPFDSALAQSSSDKAVRVIQATEGKDLLPRVTSDPENFLCRFCSRRNPCWKESNTLQNFNFNQLIR